MTKKNISERKRLAAIFVSFSIVIMGTASLLQTMSLDYYSVIGTVEKILPACVILGGIGWVMGMILDKPKKRYGGQKNYHSIFLNDIAKSDISDITSLPAETGSESENNIEKEVSEIREETKEETKESE